MVLAHQSATSMYPIVKYRLAKPTQNVKIKT